VKTGPIIVQKYGGSSLADVEHLGHVADRVVAARCAGHSVVVVVSAMGKTTDGLIDLAQQAARTGGQAGGEVPRRELDMLVSTGERISMSLLSIAIQARGIEAISFTGSQCGIITNDRHFDARIIEVRPHRIEDALARGCVVIVAGYQGMSYKREITTLGRGGSDTTAVALAAALGAERAEIYSDVDGVYSADPRSVRDAQHLPEIDCDTLQQMAHGGAKVLCEQAVEWARKAGIAVYVRNTSDAVDSVSRETVIRKFAPQDRPAARGVTCDTEVALVVCRDVAAVDGVMHISADSGVTVREAWSGGGHGVLLTLRNAPNWREIHPKLTAIDGARVHDVVAFVSVVGDDLMSDASCFERFRACLRDAEVLATMAMPLRLSAIIEQRQAAAAQRQLHDAFIRDRAVGLLERG
jgi:aspartate kinase